ncbi:MAG: phospholipid carrier-dependent glycosyltransferase [Lachnospiraceae bacterium]|nr:phospholipid carrier-dependent glycosyltransferase [Lachnospiraceae bacterium]
MSKIILITILSIITFVAFYISYFDEENLYSKKGSNTVALAAVFVTAFFLRLYFGGTHYGHTTDMGCFDYWSTRVLDVGFKDFYSPEIFSDYPPGYMYVLYVVAALRRFFGVAYKGFWDLNLIKLPAYICDMLIGAIIYKLSSERFSKSVSVLLAAFFLFNPMTMLDSAFWGQVDSVYTLFIVLMLYAIYKGYMPLAYISFAIGFFIKPQMLLFSPALLAGIWDGGVNAFYGTPTEKNGQSGVQRLFRYSAYQVAWIIVSALAGLAIVAPFGVKTVFHQYVDTVMSYPYASINAFNIWTLFGQNWASQDNLWLSFTLKEWSYLFVGIFAVLAMVMHFRDTKRVNFAKRKDAKYAIISAFLMTVVFALSVRMHERYIYPVIAVLLIAYIFKPVKELFVSFVAVSAVAFLNSSYVLYMMDEEGFDPNVLTARIIAALLLLVFAYLTYSTVKILFDKESKTDKATVSKDRYGWLDAIKGKKNDNENSLIRLSKERIRLDHKDAIYLIIIMAVYAAIAFYHLGGFSSPETLFTTSEEGVTYDIDLGAGAKPTSIAYYPGPKEEQQYMVWFSDTEEDDGYATTDVTMTSVFAWGETEVLEGARYAHIQLMSDTMSINELVFKDAEGNVIEPQAYDEEIAPMFDEQELYPKRSTYMDSTYFDEIYHARTAYEYIHGLPAYENTHPPLGKIFISIGILIFGMNPFGWRFVGTLFGVLMIPVIYYFAKNLFERRFLTVVSTILFTFDFMHFAQTRISTIDVYITFFVICMYAFMYVYTRMSFYDTPLLKTFLPLGLSGVSMGLGIASKWTGIYAGAGLAVIFFLHLYQRWKEYQLAKNEPDKVTDAALRETIINTFWKNTGKTIGFCVVFFVVIPAVIYLLSYIPFVDYSDDGLFGRMIANQQSMFSYHSTLEATHPFSSWWYQWPVMYRPIWYYAGTVSDTVSEGISAFGNPLVWWVGIPAFVYVLYRFLVKKDEVARFLTIGYLAQYLPWFFVTRITFIYHYFPSVPFVVMMIGYSMYRILKFKGESFKKYIIVYTVGAVALFIMFYPVLSGFPVKVSYVSTFLRWFESWVLIS